MVHLPPPLFQSNTNTFIIERQVKMAYIKKTNNPNMGRPTNEPRTESLLVRLSKKDIANLDYCTEQTGLKKADIVRQGIVLVMESLKSNNPQK